VYKNNSRNMQRGHGVARIQADADGSDVLPPVEAMTRDALVSERALIVTQKSQLEIEAQAQKRAGHSKVVKGVGYRIQTLCARLSAINGRIREIDRRSRSHAEQALLDIAIAVREHLPPGGIPAKAFISRVLGAIDNDQINPLVNRLLAQETPTRQRQDRNGLGPKDGGSVVEDHAPKHQSDTPS